MLCRFFLPVFLLTFLSFAAEAQTPGLAELHRPSSFDNSFSGSLPDFGPARSGEDGRYGFAAIFEWRIAPGVVKTFDVRQFYSTEALAVQGFMRVQSALPSGTDLIHIEWMAPTTGDAQIGN
jgi:hypothetical protein